MNKVIYQFPIFLEKLSIGDLARLKKKIKLKSFFWKKKPFFKKIFSDLFLQFQVYFPNNVILNSDK